MLCRGFLIGDTSGRTTLNGEGLQHQDGHNHILADAIPNCISYDPTFAYEVAVIFHAGMKRMYERGEDLYYYLTTLNENYRMPAMPEGVEEGIAKGLYRLQAAAGDRPHRVQLMGSGSILREVLPAAELQREDWSVDADVWSAPSFNELARDGHACARWNILHPEQEPLRSWVEQCLAGAPGPTIASTDYVRSFAEQIRAFVPGDYRVVGTDGFGRSDSRAALRRHFEVDRRYVTVAALKTLADQHQDDTGDGRVGHGTLLAAIDKYGIDAEKPFPLYA